MYITWKDGVTTATAAGAVLVERAHFHDYAWPLVSSTRWAIGIIMALLAAGFISSYMLDGSKSPGWAFVASFLIVVGLLFTGLGMASGDANYAVMLMVTTVIFWLAAVVRHLTVRKSLSIART
jgi:hypothetical protein